MLLSEIMCEPVQVLLQGGDCCQTSSHSEWQALQSRNKQLLVIYIVQAASDDVYSLLCVALFVTKVVFANFSLCFQDEDSRICTAC